MTEAQQWLERAKAVADPLVEVVMKEMKATKKTRLETIHDTAMSKIQLMDRKDVEALAGLAIGLTTMAVQNMGNMVAIDVTDIIKAQKLKKTVGELLDDSRN